MKRCFASLLLLFACGHPPSAPVAQTYAADAASPVDATSPQAVSRESLLPTAFVAPNGHVLFFSHEAILEWRGPAQGTSATTETTPHPCKLDRVAQPIAGKMFLTVKVVAAGAAKHEEVSIWDATTLTRNPVPLEATAEEIPFSDDGTKFALTSCGGSDAAACTTTVYDEGGKRLGKVDLPNGAKIWLSPAGTYLRVTYETRADVYEVASARRVLRHTKLDPSQLRGDRSPSLADDAGGRELLAFASDDRLVVSRGVVVETVNLKNGSVRIDGLAGRSPNSSVSYVLSPDHTRIATLLDQEKTVRIRSLVGAKGVDKTIRLEAADLCNRCTFAWVDARHLWFGELMHDTQVTSLLVDVETGERTLQPSVSLELFPFGFRWVRQQEGDKAVFTVVAPNGAVSPSATGAFTPSNGHLVESHPEQIRVLDRDGKVVVAY